MAASFCILTRVFSSLDIGWYVVDNCSGNFKPFARLMMEYTVRGGRRRSTRHGVGTQTKPDE